MPTLSENLAGEQVSPTIIDRFFSKIQQHGHPQGCWIWTGYINNRGYGMMARGGSFKVPILAHRVSYIMHRGPLKHKTDCVCHSCDNPACVNPEHLWIGTHAENLRDMVIKGRWTPRRVMRGELHKLHKLTEDAVIEIRTTDTPQRQLAIKFGVSQTSIWRVRNHVSWPGVTQP